MGKGRLAVHNAQPSLTPFATHENVDCKSIETVANPQSLKSLHASKVGDNELRNSSRPRSAAGWGGLPAKETYALPRSQLNSTYKDAPGLDVLPMWGTSPKKSSNGSMHGDFWNKSDEYQAQQEKSHGLCSMRKSLLDQRVRISQEQAAEEYYIRAMRPPAAPSNPKNVESDC